ncbi:TPA: hypothetical protein ACHY18_001554 [Escherichia coli]
MFSKLAQSSIKAKF